LASEAFGVKLGITDQPKTGAPVRILSAADILGASDYPALVEALRNAHREPPPMAERTLMRSSGRGSDSGFLIWPAWREGAALGIKIITIFPDNPQRAAALPAVQGVYQLFDGETGTPVAMLDGIALTFLKTAADSALGADYLARRDVDTMLMVGAGALAPHLVRAHVALRPAIGQVLIWNRSPARAEAMAAGLGDLGRPVAVAHDLEAAVRAAGLITCATGARAPLIRGVWLTPGTHVYLVGGFTSEMREADDEAVRHGTLFVDSRAFTIDHCGDVTGPISAGIITADDIAADLFDLAAGRHPGRRDDREITLYKNGGGGHLDLFIACALFERCKSGTRG